MSGLPEEQVAKWFEDQVEEPSLEAEHHPPLPPPPPSNGFAPGNKADNMMENGNAVGVQNKIILIQIGLDSKHLP
jgi:hypothetical protein